MTEIAYTLEEIRGFEERRKEWGALAEASGNVFLTPEWLSAWWETFGGGHELTLRMCRRSDGTPVAILPLYRDRRRPQVLRFVGHTQSDLLGPVCAPEDRLLAAKAMSRTLRDESIEIFVGNSLAVAEGWAAGLGGTVLDRMASPTLVLAGKSWDDLLAERSSNFRSQMRRVERRLARSHGTGWRVATAATVERDLETLVGLHRARWDGASGAFEARWGELHRRFAPVAQERGWLRLMVLELDGRPAAALYNMRFGGSEWFYQSGRDPSHDRLQLGLAAQIQAIRAAAEAGVREYRFLRGPEPYKARFADRDDSVETIVVPLGRGGVLLTHALRLLPRLPRPARDRLRRLVD